MKLGDREPDDHAGEADDRADRQVELAADHQQRHRRRDDAELGGNLEDVEQPARE